MWRYPWPPSPMWVRNNSNFVSSNALQNNFFRSWRHRWATWMYYELLSNQNFKSKFRIYERTFKLITELVKYEIYCESERQFVIDDIKICFSKITALHFSVKLLNIFHNGRFWKHCHVICSVKLWILAVETISTTCSRNLLVSDSVKLFHLFYNGRFWNYRRVIFSVLFCVVGAEVRSTICPVRVWNPIL